MNYGALIGSTQSGAYLRSGSVTNFAGGQISGTWGVAIKAGGSVVNDGTLIGTGQSGAYLESGGSVTNLADGRISGNIGVDIRAASGTLATAGTIAGTGGIAVSLAAGFANALVVTPGAAFTGVVEGGNTIGGTAVSTLELAAGVAAGRLSGVGSQFVDFGAIKFDPGAAWLLSGNTAGLAGTIDGFATGDTIEITGVSGTLSGFSAGVLSLSSPSGPIDLNLSGDFSGRVFNVSDVAAGTDIVLGPVACFGAGTRIATLRGEVAVEALRPGDQIMLAGGGAAPVVWLGHRRIDCRRHPRRHDVLPVRVQSGAFGDGLPRRDLMLSPDHAVFCDGVLIPVRYLLNGRTIAQQRAAEVTYFHVELAAHSVILADGLPCETYLDTGNRSAFANGGSAVMLHPDFSRCVWAEQGCAELVTQGPRLAAARRLVLARAVALGNRLTDAPRLRVAAGGHALDAEISDRSWRVRLPPGARSVRLISRRGIPAHARADETDSRCLGVAVANLRLDGEAVRMDDARLTSGWHAPEPCWRWTDGDAGLALAGVREVEFDIAITGTYWVNLRRRTQAAAA